MTILIYPNNSAYPENNPAKFLGTNETFGIPEVRQAMFPKTKDDVEIYYRNGHKIKAFYTTLDQKSREEYLREYNREYLKMKRNNTSRNKKETDGIECSKFT